MDTSDSLIDPEAEVRKLQDLVKKLEHQNELLRSKQKLQLDPLQNGDTDRSDRLIKNVNNNLPDARVEGKNRGQRIPSTCSQDEHDIIDLDSLSLKDEEDSWLYSSPKKPPTPMQSRVSPITWVRQDFDKPSPEIVSARKTLAYKLEEVARGMGRSPSTPAFSLNRSYTDTSSKGNRMSLSAPVPATHGTPQQPGKSGHYGGLGSRVDTSTFTRPKKNRDSGGARSRTTEPREDVPNVSDIQNLAKMQEESLRQSLNSPLGSPRKAMKQRQLPQMVAVSSNDVENSCSPHSSNRSSPGRFEVSDPGHPRRQSGSMMSSGSQDSVNSPPDSPYGSQYLQGNQPHGRSETTRRSLPNLSKSNGMPNRLHRSDPSIDDGSVEDDDGAGSVDSKLGGRAQPTSSGRASSPSMSGLKQPMMVRRAMSPQRSGLPTPNRSGIPRPASAAGGRSSLPTPTRRSGIPSPRTVGRSHTPIDNFTDSDESWKEGCF
ncbi:SLAIN motif-containing protein 2-like isoform X1 [Liolophura sinensis]|uniref:SLAIN motif-containing protein 2-like isoform X1 n=1 Tax=Liolophura sinensis TaxID=3198878 RepID=UPI0031590C74